VKKKRRTRYEYFLKEQSLFITTNSTEIILIHSLSKLVDALFSVTGISSFDKVLNNRTESTSRRVEVEGPQKSVNSGKVRSHSGDFVDDIFNANNSEFSEVLFNDMVVQNGNSLTIHFNGSSFVDEFANSFQVGVSPGNVRLNEFKHVQGCFVQLDKNCVVDLSQSHELQDFSGFGVHLIDTKNFKLSKEKKEMNTLEYGSRGPILLQGQRRNFHFFWHLV
jgi:hypothetical protein